MYSQKRDVLVIPMRGAAYSAKDGSKLWQQRMTWDAAVKDDVILANQGGHFTAFGKSTDLMTGKGLDRRHPLTGAPASWEIMQTGHGCDVALTGEHIMAFRSGSASYYDLSSDSGIVNLGAFKSGCSASLVPAGGVLAAPNFASYCTCSYPIWTALAMIHMPEMEMWSAYGKVATDGVVRRVGLNFGAPGDRRASNRTLWLDYPSTGGLSPDIPVETEPAQLESYRHHVSWIAGGEGAKWVAASGVKGLRSATIYLNVKTVEKTEEFTRYNKTRTRKVLHIVPADGPVEPRLYTVRLHFAEPEKLRPGQRVFSVSLQGKEVLADFDIVAEAGGPNRSVVKEFERVRAGDELKIVFTPKAGEPVISGIELVDMALPGQ